MKKELIMNRLKLTFPLLFAMGLFTIGTVTSCTEDVEVAPDRTQVKTADVFPRTVDRTTIWADCELFGSIVTPAHFDPANGNFDELYMNPNGFAEGVNLISDAKPGDQDYNGGRWHVNVLDAAVDYSDACGFEDLNPDDFMSTDMYFECPLTPRRGNGQNN